MKTSASQQSNIVSQSVLTSQEYRDFITGLKSRIQSARISAARAMNSEAILLYWDIGQGIVERQRSLGWGESVVELVSADLRREFPQATGFSARSVWDMRRFYLFYTDAHFLDEAARTLSKIINNPNLQQLVAEFRILPLEIAPSEAVIPFLRRLVAEIPWGQNLVIINKVATPQGSLWYLQATARFGWTRNVLLNQIKAGAYERAVADKKSHNFGLALPAHLAEQAEEMLKSSYNLEFLGIRRAVKERELEDRLISRLQAFLMELGYGFCFVGRQYRIAAGKKEYFIDLLFYHRFLKALVAFELKVGSFEPEFAGKMDFYLTILDEKERAPGDQPSIGIILCAEKDDIEVEYALRTKSNAIGVATYELQSKLPGEFKGKLPTQKQLADLVRAEYAN